MFDIAWGEFAVIAVVALIVIGPKELPAVLRAIGQWTAKVRRMAADFQGQFQEALREAEMADLKKEVDEFNARAESFKSQFSDPLNSVQDAAKWEPKPGVPAAEGGEAAATPAEPASSDGTAVPTAAGSESAAVEPAATEAVPATEPAGKEAPSAPEESGVKAEGGVHP